ncbi:MAG: hypothetical protein QXU54_01540 [Candidatus Micrarchaeia archaeon]
MSLDLRVVSIGLAIAVIWSIYLILLKLSVTFVADMRSLAFFLGLGAFLVFVFYALYNSQHIELRISGPSVIALLAGVFWAVGLLILYTSISHGIEISRLSPLIGLSILFVSIMGIFLLNEAPVEWFQILIGAGLVTLGIYVIL